MWASYARKTKGFIACFTSKRVNASNQYASIYVWNTETDYERFMKKYHDWLAGRSKSKVKALGKYYNLKVIDRF